VVNVPARPRSRVPAAALLNSHSLLGSALQGNRLAATVSLIECSASRIEIAARLEKLRDIPGLHTVERQAIDDALGGLHSLECTEKRDADNERRIAERALQSLRVIA